MNTAPYVNESNHLHRVIGFGDTILATLLSPSPKLRRSLAGRRWAEFHFPTATNSRLGQNKWQWDLRVSSAILAKIARRSLSATVVFGRGTRPQSVSQMNIQYFFVYLPGDGWGIGTSPNMLVNWYANKSGNEITFPIGLNVSKVIKINPLPVKFQVQGQYMPVHPDVFGQKWNLLFSVTPVIPKLIKGNILGN
jgi:hypothetical protein